MLRTLSAFALIATVASPARAANHPRPIVANMGHGDYKTPGIRLWTADDDVVRRGERVRLYYRTEHDAYVTIFRVDTDGRVHLLFPRTPDVRIEDFTPHDYKSLCQSFLGIGGAMALDFPKIHRFAPMLNAHQLKWVSVWFRHYQGDAVLDTEQFIEFLRSRHLASNVDLSEVKALLVGAAAPVETA